MNYVKCPECHNYYEQDEPWKKVCTACYYAKKNKLSDINTRHNDHWLNKYNEAVDEINRLRGLNTLLLARRPQEIEQSLLSKLIRLCHPDKHSNSESSNECTKYLLGLRK